MHKLLNDRGFVAKAAVLAACACLLSFPTVAQFRTTEQSVELSGALSDTQTKFKTYDFGKKEDREEFDKIVDTLVNNKISSCFHLLPSFCKFKNNYWS